MKQALLLWLAGTMALAGEPLTNYRGDRNGYFAGCTPPTEWNGATGKNVRWKTPMPNWTYGTPIVVGNRVFTLSEPGWKSDFPELVCVDADTGKILWTREINHLHLSAPDEARRKPIAAAWHNYLDRFRAAYRLFGQAWTAKMRNDQAAQDAVTAQAKSMGWFDEKKDTFFRSGYRASYGQLRGWGDDKTPGVDPKLGLKVIKDLNPAGLSVDHWYGFGSAREGVTFPAPVSDGRHVYVSTIFCSHACFDLDGKLVWMDWRVPDMEIFKYSGFASKRRCFFCKSPLLVDGLFISEVSGDIEARDAKNGKLVWHMKYHPGPNRGAGTTSSSKTMDLDGVGVLVQSSGRIVRVSDGKVMLVNFAHPVTTVGDNKEAGTDDSRDLVFAAPEKGKLAAWRLTRQGEEVKATEVWRVNAETDHTMAIHGGAIYTGTHVVDIETGAVKNWGPRAFTRWQIAVAGGKVWGLRAAQSAEGKIRGVSARNDIAKAINDVGLMRVKTLDGKTAGENPLLVPAPDEERAQQRLAMMGSSTKPGEWADGCCWGFSYSCPFTFAGPRIYIRSLDELICVGER
jgi:outer membrane protein assembly factor BamB